MYPNVNIFKRAHKTPEFLARNSFGQLPVLQLDDDQYLCESLAICRYFEALHPEPTLFGTAALEKALIEMWSRRAEFRLWSRMAQVWINDDERTARVNPHQFKEYGAFNREHVAQARAWFNSEMSAGRSFLAGQFSMADIVHRMACQDQGQAVLYRVTQAAEWANLAPRLRFTLSECDPCTFPGAQYPG